MTVAPPLVLCNGRLPDGTTADIQLADGRIATIIPGPSNRFLVGADQNEQHDLNGLLVLPGLIDGHIHLDKTFAGRPWRPHIAGQGVAARVNAEKESLRDEPASIETRAFALVCQAAAYGTAHMRSHVDIDSGIGLNGVEALLAIRDAGRHLIDIQLVAFPQSGILADPGTAALMDESVRLGVDAVGGLDPASFDGDVERHLDVVFGIAERRGALIDIHLHDAGELGAFELRRIAARSKALSMQGRVTVSHAFALGAIDDDTFGLTAEHLAEAGVSILTNGPGPEPIPPIKRLREAGVTVMAGSDNIRDSWSPYGNGDMLERTRLIGYRSGFLTDADLDLAFDLATDAAAGVLGITNYGLAVGAAADLVAVDACSVPEAVATSRSRALVIKGGRLIARDGSLVA